MSKRKKCHKIVVLSGETLLISYEIEQIKYLSKHATSEI